MSNVIKLQRVTDKRGWLTIVNFEEMPFAVKRAFWMHHVPTGAVRGRHAHKKTHQAVFVASGWLDLSWNSKEAGIGGGTLFEGASGVHIPPLTWLELRGFSPTTICVVFCSTPYDEDDYIRNYDEFKRRHLV